MGTKVVQQEKMEKLGTKLGARPREKIGVKYGAK